MWFLPLFLVAIHSVIAAEESGDAVPGLAFASSLPAFLQPPSRNAASSYFVVDLQPPSETNPTQTNKLNNDDQGLLSKLLFRPVDPLDQSDDRKKRDADQDHQHGDGKSRGKRSYCKKCGASLGGYGGYGGGGYGGGGYGNYGGGYGGGGGCGTGLCGGGQPVYSQPIYHQQPVYQQPLYGGGGGGGCSACGYKGGYGGGGGGLGGSYSSSQASSSSGSFGGYGKK